MGRRRDERGRVGLWLLGLAMSVPASAWATNGMNAIAQSSRSAGMGGADYAVAEDHSAMNTNPAGITQYDLQLGGTVNLLMPSISLSDRVYMSEGYMPLNNDVAALESTFPLMGLGLTSAIAPNLYAGIGFYVQGGMGAEFDHLGTMVDDDPTSNLMAMPQPGTYSMRSQVAFMKLTPALAYRFELDEATVSVGAALNVGFAQMSFTHTGFQFREQDADHVYQPHTVEFQSDNAVGAAGRLGVLAEFMDGDFAVGAAYQSATRLTFGGSTAVDRLLFYNDVEAEFGWPQELGAGFSVRPIGDLLLALDMRWIEWSATMTTFTLENEAAEGTIEHGYEVMVLPFYMRWQDQIVTAAGAEYQPIEELTLRTGFNYGASPVGADGINPLFPAVSEWHYTVGLGITPIPPLRIDTAVEYVPPVTVTTDASNQLTMEPTDPPGPNGYEVDVTMSQVAFHISANYAF